MFKKQSVFGIVVAIAMIAIAAWLLSQPIHFGEMSMINGKIAVSSRVALLLLIALMIKFIAERLTYISRNGRNSKK